MPDHELVARIAHSTGLTESESARVIEDVLAWYAESPQDYVRRRHAHLQLYGTRNDEAFRQIVRELPARLVQAPALTERQVRRIVYG